MDYEILNSVNSPEQLKALGDDETISLCSEIRDFLIENVERAGGHLASNLGVVELTVALHKIFNSPSDRIIFDVGHQSYVHKILTGRKNAFVNLRRPGGLSGFTTRREGEHDPFGAGHSSTALSAALGFAEADILSGSGSYNICIIGDGAYTGGMVHEALNNCRPDMKLIIILNENRMSISKNKGAFASYIAKIRISEGYMKWKRGTKSVLGKIPLIGRPIEASLSFVKKKIKKLIYTTNYFENLGLYYIGPVNGNDYKMIERALKEAKRLGKCTIIHTYTKKGKGYTPAEQSPDDFHSVATVGSSHAASTFHSEFAGKLTTMARDDEKIVAITAAMGIGTGLDAFGKEFPKRYFDVGIAEEHALTFSAALAAAGLKPYVAIYSTFLQRGYDNIIHDIALQNLPVRMIIDRAGLAPSDGATHHGIFDVAFLSHIPGVTIMSPVTYGSLACALELSQDSSSPIAIRYPNSKENDRISEMFYPDGHFEKFGVVADFEQDSTPKCVFVTYGNIVGRVIDAEDELRAEGIECGIVLAEKLKPFADSASKIGEYIKDAECVLFVEEGIKNGGFSMICSHILQNELKDKVYAINAIDDNFAAPDKLCNLYDYVGLSAERLAESMKKLILNKKYDYDNKY